MSGARTDEQRVGVLSAISNALVTLHKEQFGRGPTRARTNFAGEDTLVCVLEDAMLPAERVMVQMGEQQRVRESRVALQAATQDQFVAAVQTILDRQVSAFASAIDPDQGVVWEVFNLQPLDAHCDGHQHRPGDVPAGRDRQDERGGRETGAWRGEQH